MEPVSDHRPLAERYRPSSLREVVGNSRALAELHRWGQAWTRGGTPPRLRAAVLEGPPGVGKTTAALALALDFGWTVVEMNASDARNQSAVEQVAGRAAATQTLGSTGRYRTYGAGARTLILLDEADALSGRLPPSSATRPPAVNFREFVRSRYGTLDALAKAWGLGGPAGPPAFERWEQIPTTGGRAAWTRRPAAQRDLADWRSVKAPADLSDRGGLPAILRVIHDTRQPIVLTVNDWSPYARAGPDFRQSAARIRFDPVSRSEIDSLLRRVIASEKLIVARDALDAILDRAGGDVRAALNDLDAIAPLPPGAAQREVLAPRDRPTDFFAVTDEALRHPRFFRAGEIRARLDATPDDLLPWMEENVPRVAATNGATEAGLREVARADRWLSLARRQRVWALWSFASETMSGGAGLAMAAISQPNLERPLAFPQFLGLMGRSRLSRATRASIVLKIGHATHTSARKATEVGLPFVELVYHQHPARGSAKGKLRSTQDQLAEELGLTPEERAFVSERAEWVDRTSRSPPGRSSKRSPPAVPSEAAVHENGDTRRGADVAEPAKPKGTQRSLENY